MTLRRDRRPVVRKRIELRVGDQTFRILKITQAKKGDVYLAPPTPTGLHISHHASGKKHVRDNEGLHRDLLDPTPADALAFAQQFAYAPTHEAMLVVIKRPALATTSHPNVDDSPTLVVDFAELLHGLLAVELTSFKGRELKAFVQQNTGIDLIILDLTAEKIAFVQWQGEKAIALAFGEEFSSMMHAISQTTMGAKAIAPIEGSLREVSERIDAGELAHPWAHVDMARVDRELEPSVQAFVERIQRALSDAKADVSRHSNEGPNAQALR